MVSHGMLLQRLAGAVAQAPPAGPLVGRVCGAVRDLLGADGASITMEVSTLNRVTLCATDRRAELLDDLQDVVGEGPALDAFMTGTLLETGLGPAASARWPQFTPAAEEIIGPDGVMWALPMRSGGQVIGAASLYRLRPGPLAQPADGALFLADAVAATLVTDPLAYADSPGGGTWSSRSVVHQATGMLIAQLGVAADAALAILRSHAFATSARLNDVARDVVERRADLSCAPRR